MAEPTRKPLFAKIADDLRAEIERDYYPGMRFETERALAKRLQVSPVTVREALGILREEGLIERHQGSGSYVLERKRERVGVVLDFDFADVGLSHFYRSSTQAARRCLMAAGYEAPLYAGVRHVEDGKSAVTCREFVTDVQAGRLKGIVAMPAAPDPAWTKPAAKQGIPVVGSPVAFAAGIVINRPQMIRDGIEQLTKAGRKRIALIDWAEQGAELGEKPGAEAFRKTMRKKGCELRDNWILDTLHPSLAGSGREEFREIWFAYEEKPDGILICDDMLFADAKSAILELDIQVPEQLMVATHANRGSRIVYPFPVITLEIDPEEVGRLMAEKVIELLQHLE